MRREMEAEAIQKPEKTVKYPKGRKILAVDFDTYEKLEAVCHVEMRSKIDQLKVLIDRAYQNLVIQDEKN